MSGRKEPPVLDLDGGDLGQPIDPLDQLFPLEGRNGTARVLVGTHRDGAAGEEEVDHPSPPGPLSLSGEGDAESLRLPQAHGQPRMIRWPDIVPRMGDAIPGLITDNRDSACRVLLVLVQPPAEHVINALGEFRPRIR